MNKKQEEQLEKLGTTVYQGQLSHGIHGVLHDPDKLKQFISTLLQAERQSIIEMIEKMEGRVKTYGGDTLISKQELIKKL